MATPVPTLDIPCLTCGYPLRGLPSGRCPECSAEHDRRYLTTGQPPLGPRPPRPWSARKALAIGRPAWTASAAAWAALTLVAVEVDAGGLTLLCGVAAAGSLLRRMDLALRPRQVDALTGAERADLGMFVAAWGVISVGIVLAVAAVGAVTLLN